LKTLLDIGISGSLYKFYQSFLLDRTFRVRVGGVLSDPFPASSGVPQGSVLAPLLFNIYLNSLFTSLPDDLKACAYADDLKLWTINNAGKLREGIKAVEEWSMKWDLPLNVSKTQVYQIGRQRQEVFFVDGQQLEVSENIRDLGLFYDSKMSFRNHIDKKYACSMQRINLIFRAFSTKKVSTIIRLFKAFVLPIFEYLSPIWSPSDIASITKLESIQRKFTKRELESIQRKFTKQS
jgi:hypothetical protein